MMVAKNGRVRPLVMRSSDHASGSTGRPKTTAFAIPKSRVKAAIFEVTISPAVDIIVIMTNINQKIVVRSIWRGAKLTRVWLAAVLGPSSVSGWEFCIGV